MGVRNYSTSISMGERVKYRALLSFVVAATLLAPVQAFAVTQVAPTQEQLSAYETSSEGERIQLLIYFCKSGNPEYADYFLHKTPLTGPHAANRTLYVTGLIKKSRGDLTGAATDFRAALASDPKLTLVRADLAETLYELEEDESAIHHLKLLQSEAPDTETASGISSFIDQIDSRKPYRFNAYVAAAPSSNINNGATKHVIYYPDGRKTEYGGGRKPESVVGVAAGVNASYSKRYGNDQMVVVSGGLDGRVYDKSEFDSLTFSEAIELRNLTSSGYISLGLVASQSVDTQHTAVNYNSFGPRVSWRHGITNQDFLNVSATYEIRDYAHDRDHDGGALFLNGTLTHTFDSSLSATIDAGFTKVTIDSDELAYDSAYETISAGLNVYKELPLGITIDAGATIETSKFGKFPLATDDFTPRKDLRLGGNLTLTKRDLNIFGFAPSLSYSFAWNDSNTERYDYKTHAIDLRLTKEF
jgi:outer membrane protein